MTARLHGASVETYQAWNSTRHPPGVDPQYSNRPSGRIRGKPVPKRRPIDEAWAGF